MVLCLLFCLILFFLWIVKLGWWFYIIKCLYLVGKYLYMSVVNCFNFSLSWSIISNSFISCFVVIFCIVILSIIFFFSSIDIIIWIVCICIKRFFINRFFIRSGNSISSCIGIYMRGRFISIEWVIIVIIKY